ncbi:hypothetical protein GSI_11134 [Ganoderma sinense ZZ0214-1]|uniref:Uncharacterized protein n=1 Tax=Ganoderma sinense ZZ0214-1 TaxID=1077348 RepID=A0A2G8RZR7_9APHY|nr:hypothetical protein GSI_11134 [Ganoderma sinense ZZ0214-1]
MPSFPSQTHLSPSLSAHAVDYSSVPTPRSTSPLLDDPASLDVESGPHKEAEPARPSLPRRAWRKFTSLQSRMDLETIATAFCVAGLVALALALGVLISFGLNVLSTYAGGRILHYATPIRTLFSHAVVTPAYARAAFAGCAIVNVALLLVAPAVTVLVEKGRGDDAAEAACWGTLALGMLVDSAAAASLGIVVLPPERAPEGLSVGHALAAGSLGTVVVGIPVFVLGVLSCWVWSSSDDFWCY